MTKTKILSIIFLVLSLSCYLSLLEWLSLSSLEAFMLENCSSAVKSCDKSIFNFYLIEAAVLNVAKLILGFLILCTLAYYGYNLYSKTFTFCLRTIINIRIVTNIVELMKNIMMNAVVKNQFLIIYLIPVRELFTFNTASVNVIPELLKVNYS